jgi:hypothetical protein
MRNDFFPENPDAGALIQSHVEGIDLLRASVPILKLTSEQAVAKATGGLRAAITDNGSVRTYLEADLVQPPYPRVLSATYAGTNTDIKGGHQVYYEGFDMADKFISDYTAVAVADTVGTKEGTLVFKKVTKAVVPAHDGTGATTALGWTDKIGVPLKMTHAPLILGAMLGTSKEGTLPTAGFSASVLAQNWFLLNSVLAGSPVLVFFLLP